MQTELPFKQYSQALARHAKRAKTRVEKLRGDLAKADYQSEFWSKLNKTWREQRPAHILYLLRENAEYVALIREGKASAHKVLTGIAEECERLVADVASRFPKAFEMAAKKRALGLDRDSRHPNYYLKDGFLHLKVSEHDCTARIEPRDGREIVMGLDVDAVVSCLQNELKRLFEREVSPEALLDSIHRAYKAVIQSEGKKEGEDVPIRRVTAKMNKNLSRFSSDEFNIDLSRIIRAGKVKLGNLRLYLSHTRESRQGILLYGQESGGYVGLISFKEDR